MNRKHSLPLLGLSLLALALVAFQPVLAQEPAAQPTMKHDAMQPGMMKQGDMHEGAMPHATMQQVYTADSLYTCPMHPAVISANSEQDCPLCGMALTPITAPKAEDAAAQAKDDR